MRRDVEREDVEREDVEREDVEREDVPLDAPADFLVEGLPEVRLRAGALDRLAMSREYPWVAGIPGVTGVTRVADASRDQAVDTGRGESTRGQRSGSRFARDTGP